MPRIHQRVARLLTYVTLISLLSGFLPPLAHAQTSGSITRYEDTAASITYAGTWTAASSSAVSGGSTRFAKTAGSTATFTFTGPWINLGFFTAASGGKVDVAIDGTSRGVVDTYSRVDSTTSHTVADLSAGSHTLVLTVLGQRNSFASDTRVYFDYLDVWDGTALADGTFEHDSPRVIRSNNWTVQTNSSASGGSYLRDGSNVWFPFTGTSVSVDLVGESWSGAVQVFLDGVSQESFPTTAPTSTIRTLNFGNLAPGAHVLQVQSYRGRATVDAFRTPGAAPFVTPPDRSGIARSEEDDSALRYNGAPFATTSTAWTEFGNSRLSNGYGAWAKTAGSTVTFTATGTWISAGFLTASSGGKVAVAIDGTSQGTLDTYGASENVLSQVYSGLAPGTHTLTLTVLGQKQSSASDTRVHLDYIDVWDGTSMPAGTFEHDSPRIARSSTWSLSSEPQASAGSYLRGGTNLWVPFTGDSITYQAWTWSSASTVDLLIDGTVRQSVNLSGSPAALRAWTLDGLGAGAHVLQVRAAQGTAVFDTATVPGRPHGSPPTHLRVLTTTDTSITLAWDAATATGGVASYDVLANDVVVGTTAGTSTTLPNLLPGTAYNLTVRARATAGTVSTASEPLSAATSGPPTQVTLSATLSPDSATTDERAFSLVVEARDQTGALVTNYRGAVDFTPSAATIGLPQASGADYTFTAGDAGRKTFPSIAFTAGGTQTITVTDRSNPGLAVTSNAVSVQAVRLVVTASPTTIAAGEPGVSVTVAAQDDAGHLLPDYRGKVTFSSTSAMTGLPKGGLGGQTYTFTAGDGGQHTWTGVTLNTTGNHAITVLDGIRQGTSTPIAVQIVQLTLTVSPTTVFAGEPALAVTVMAQDADGNLVPGYRGTVTFSSSSAMTGLPKGGLGGQTYTFTAGDGGQHTWSGATLNTAGDQTISVSDGTRQATSASITVQAVHLTVAVSPTVVFAGEPAATVTVTARDQNDAVVPGYRGTVTFSSSSAMTGLPKGGLGGSTYAFRAGDGGQHTWSGVTLNTAGDQTVTVSDGTRQATSAPVTVKAVQLTATISPTLFFAGEPVQVLVTARDQDDAVVPGYRGTVTFSSSSTITGLPQGGLGGSTYTFTAGDAGQHTWSGATLNTAGDQTVTVSDGTRQVTSNTVTVKPIAFQITFDPPTSYVNDATLTMTLEVVDAAGAVVPGYRGAIDLNPSVPMRGLPQGTFALNPDYVFTAADAGQHVFPSLGFTATGDQTITVVDRGNPSTQTTSGAVGVGLPPAPTPAAAGPLPPTVIFPFTIPGQQPEPFPFSWAPPYRAMEAFTGPNHWAGFPRRPVPAGPGAFAITSGISQRGPLEWWAGTFYMCVATGWENPLTSVRELNGGSIGYLPWEDPTFVGGYGSYGCGKWSGMTNGGAITGTGPFLAGPAPAGTQGTHMNPRPSGNAGGAYVMAVNTAGDDIGCDGSTETMHAADPVDTRSGAFFLRETDLGVATGCTNVALQFTRTYHTLTGASSVLSPGWVHNYEQRIKIIGDYALVQRPSGGTLLFKDVGGDVYAAPAGAKHTLVKRAGGGWALIYRTQRVDVFDAAGRLVAEQDPNGNQIWLTYESYQRNGVSGTRLARVDAPGGRFLWFGYDYYRPERISVVGDNAGRSVHYRYDDADAYDFTSTGKLVGVTDPLGHTSQYTGSE